MGQEMKDLLMATTTKYSYERIRTRIEVSRIDVFPLCQTELCLWHNTILKAIRRPTRTVDPFGIRIKRDVPVQIFDAILSLSTTNMYGTTMRRTRATTTVNITQLEKLKSILNFMNCGKPKALILRPQLLKKKFPGGETGELLVSKEAPFTIKYAHNQAHVVLSGKFGFWNSHGIPQHGY